MLISRLDLAETAVDLPLCSEHVVVPQKDDLVIAESRRLREHLGVPLGKRQQSVGSLL